LAVGLLTLAATAGAGTPEGPKATAATPEGPKALEIGKAVPMADVKMVNVDGKSFSIADVKGAKGTLVIFTCNSCPWVKAWESRITELGNTYAKQGIGVIAINSNDTSVKPEDDMPAMKERAKTLGLAFPYVIDATSGVARAFGATRTPEAFLFDAQGKLAYHGAVDDNAHKPAEVTVRWLNDALSSTAAGKAVAVKETKSLGCTIKFRNKAATSSS
jgi:peroxiredoxin